MRVAVSCLKPVGENPAKQAVAGTISVDGAAALSKPSVGTRFGRQRTGNASVRARTSHCCINNDLS